MIKMFANKVRMKKEYELARAYAHRGYHCKPEIPENSMAAFRRALEHGMASELDVHLIHDGTLVVFHDDDLISIFNRTDTLRNNDFGHIWKVFF